MKKVEYVFILIALFFTITAALGAAWTTKRLTYTAGWTGCSRIAACGANIYAVWFDDTPGNREIYFRKSIDSGVTWQTAKRLSNNSGASEVAVIAASGQNVYVVWQDLTPGNYEIYFRRSTDGGATWHNAVRLTNNTGFSGYPQIAVYQDSLYVVWEDDTPGNMEIYLRKSTNRGSTWQAAKRLTNNSSGTIYPTISVDIENIYLAYADNGTGSYELYFKRSADYGATWLTAKRLTYNAIDSQNRGAYITTNGANIYIVWMAYPSGNGEIYFRRSTDRGATWQNAKRLTNNAGTSNFPTIAVSDTNVYVAWYDDTPGNKEIYFRKSTDNGATWQAIQNLSNNTGESTDPAIATNSTRIFITWTDYVPPNPSDVYLKYSPL